MQDAHTHTHTLLHTHIVWDIIFCCECFCTCMCSGWYLCVVCGGHVHVCVRACMHHWSRKHLKQETLYTLTNFWHIQAELHHCLVSSYSGVCRVLLYSFIFHPFCFCSHSLSCKGSDVCTCVAPIHCACTFHIHSQPVCIPVQICTFCTHCALLFEHLYFDKDLTFLISTQCCCSFALWASGNVCFMVIHQLLHLCTCVW